MAVRMFVYCDTRDLTHDHGQVDAYLNLNHTFRALFHSNVDVLGLKDDS